MKKIIVAVMLAVVSMFGVSGGSVAEAAENEMMIGFVNLDAVFSAYPGIADAQKTIFSEQKALQEEFNSKAEGLSDEEKVKLQHELNQKLAAKQIEVMKPIQEKVSKAVAKAAKQKGLNQVVKAEIMLWGGIDLTQDVITLVQ